MRTVVITGADRGVGFALCQCFAKGGWRIFAGQFMPEWKELENLKKVYGDQLILIPMDVGNTESVKKAVELIAQETESIDMIINCAGISSMLDNQKMLNQIVNVNTIGALRIVEGLLPFMKSEMKRLCFVSSEAGCVSLAHRTDSFSYCMSKRALNMAVKLMFNQLSPEGYTFRLYHPGWVRSYMMGTKSDVGNFEPEETAEVAYKQFTEDREWEDVLAMTDVSNELWPF